MKVYFSGGPSKKLGEQPKRGSFEMRGRQIASMGNDWSASWNDGCYPVDVFVMVKKLDSRARVGRKVVLDVVDPWPQKPRNATAGAELDNARLAIQWFTKHIEAMQRIVKIDSIICTNKLMYKHLRKKVAHAEYIYHHYHPTIPITPIKEEMKVVGYWGNKTFLGEWLDKITAVCKKMGLLFVVNPEDISSVDVMVAARGGVYDNYMAKAYKSNVKLANCYGSGTPCILTPEQSYLETNNGEVLFFETEGELAEMLEELRPVSTRRRIHEAHLSTAEQFSISTIAKQYAGYFERVRAL